MSTSAATPKRLAFLRALPDRVGVGLHGRGSRLRQISAGRDARLSKLEFGQGSHVNVPIGVLLWLMIYPMMLKVDFGAIGGIAQAGPKG